MQKFRTSSAKLALFFIIGLLMAALAVVGYAIHRIKNHNVPVKNNEVQHNLKVEKKDLCVTDEKLNMKKQCDISIDETGTKKEHLVLDMAANDKKQKNTKALCLCLNEATENCITSEDIRSFLLNSDNISSCKTGIKDTECNGARASIAYLESYINTFNEIIKPNLSNYINEYENTCDQKQIIHRDSKITPEYDKSELNNNISSMCGQKFDVDCLEIDIENDIEQICAKNNISVDDACKQTYEYICTQIQNKIAELSSENGKYHDMMKLVKDKLQITGHKQHDISILVYLKMLFMFL